MGLKRWQKYFIFYSNLRQYIKHRIERVFLSYLLACHTRKENVQFKSYIANWEIEHSTHENFLKNI